MPDDTTAAQPATAGDPETIESACTEPAEAVEAVTAAGTRLEPGNRYRLRYRVPGQRRDREAVMTFLGESGDILAFSARPVAGTQDMPPGWLLSAEPVARDVAPYVGRVLR